MGLSLTRHIDEEIVLNLNGEEVIVRVTDVRSGRRARVKLTFIAAKTVTIHRKEVLERIAEELKEEPASTPC